MTLHLRHILSTLCIAILSCFINSTYAAETLAPDQSESSSYYGNTADKNPWWYNEEGLAKYKNRQYEEAITNFSKAIALEANTPDFYYNRANAFTLNDQQHFAYKDYKTTLQLNPEYIVSKNRQGWKYLKEEGIYRGISFFIDWLKIMPRDPDVFIKSNIDKVYLQLINELGWESIRNDEQTKAIRYFEKYIAIAPNDANAFLGMALVFFNYRNYDQSIAYLNEAKNIESSLFQGFAGISSLENENRRFSDKDKKMLEYMFVKLNNQKQDLKQITTSSAWKFISGFIYIFLGIIALFIFIFRLKHMEGFIFHLALLNFFFGLNLIYNNPLVQLTELPAPEFWTIIIPLIQFFTPISFILFTKYFIGWGWKKSILWLFIFSIVQGIFKLVSDYTITANDIYGNSNTIFGILVAMILLSNLLNPEMRKNKEVQFISAGLGIYLIAVVYDNMVYNQWLPKVISLDEPAYFIFNLCLIYIAFNRINQTEKEYLAVRQDLETARNIQSAILPDKMPTGDNFEVSSAYLPMALIGGDYYDYNWHNDNHIGIIIADVSGHGISAALIASMMKVSFNSIADSDINPSQVLQNMNAGLTGQLNNEFITAAYLGVDLNKKELTYSSAGHPPLIVFRRIENSIEELKVAGIPIGVYDETEFKQTTIPLVKGDRLIMYTDGILEVFNPSGEIFGKNHFIDLIKETKNLLAEDVVDSLLASIHDWSGKKEGESQEDDITLIVFDVN